VTAERKRRSWGTIHQLPSGRYRARFNDHNGRPVWAPTTFVRKAAAEVWLAARRREHESVKVRVRRSVSWLQSQTIDPAGCYVYVLWGADHEVPVYVGQSMNICQRIGAHMSDREKRALTRSIELIPCASADLMDRTELRLIREYRPLLNVVGAMPNE
jgi:predicted GIY-YIG superfamily endonuclease